MKLPSPEHKRAPPLHLILDFTPKMSHVCAAQLYQTVSLSAKMPSPISNLSPSTHAPVENHLQRAVLLCWQWFFCWYKSQLWYADSLHISLTFCMLRLSETTIESNGSEKDVGTSRKLNNFCYPVLTQHRKSILVRDRRWGLETSSSSVFPSSMRPRHPVTADFILAVPLCKK